MAWISLLLVQILFFTIFRLSFGFGWSIGIDLENVLWSHFTFGFG